MQLRAVLFDWGGTLTPWHTLDPAAAWLEATGDPDLAARLAAAEDAAWLRSRDAQESARLHEVFAAVGVEASDDVLRRYHDWWEPHTLTDPDVPALFAGLRARGLRIGVLSNTMWPREHHERIFRRDEVLALLDGAVYTCELPVTKPHPDAFRAALAAVGVDDPAQAVFVGDRPYDDISGAKAAGMRAVLIPHSTIPEAQIGTYDAAAGAPDAVIDRLLDLLDVLDRWRSPDGPPGR